MVAAGAALDGLVACHYPNAKIFRSQKPAGFARLAAIASAGFAAASVTNNHHRIGQKSYPARPGQSAIETDSQAGLALVSHRFHPRKVGEFLQNAAERTRLSFDRVAIAPATYP